jgi:Tfp pilus assembly protein PilO
MMQRAADALARLNPRLVQVLVPLFVVLVLFEGWMLVLRKPVAEYQQLESTRAGMEASLRQMPDQSGELASLAGELKQLSDRLRGELHLPASDDQMAAALMAALDKSAAAHGVQFAGVKPGERKQVLVFEEVSFDVSAKGSYLQLCAWMQDFGNALGNSATITEFEMKSAEEGRQVAVAMKVALYRPLPSPGAAP